MIAYEDFAVILIKFSSTKSELLESTLATSLSKREQFGMYLLVIFSLRYKIPQFKLPKMNLVTLLLVEGRSLVVVEVLK